MKVRSISVMVATAVVLLLALRPGVATAQARPTNSLELTQSRIDIFAGYSNFRPYESDINGYLYQPINLGAEGSVAFYFNKFVGVEAEGGFHPDGPNDCVFSAQAGPIFRYQVRHFVPFIHGTAGGAKVGGPVFQPCTWGFGATGGLGFDYITPFFHERLALRPIQADYNYNRVDFGPLILPGGYAGGLIKMNAISLSSGVVLRFGNVEPPYGAAESCSVKPDSVYPGEPVTVAAATTGLIFKKKTTYTWTTTGGKVQGTGDTVTIDTTGLAPGDYKINGKVSQGSRARQNATCDTAFTVKAFEPPTLSCSANPSTVRPGDSSTITSTATSLQNRPLTYSYSATAGQITGSGPSVTLSTSGVPTGTITITCNVVDDLGKTATATTTVEVQQPAVPEAPKVQDLCSISFDRDRKRPERVDNEAKGCLDDVALTLQRSTDARLVIVANHEADETPDAAAQRAVNAKLYLTREKGIDGSRIVLRSGSSPARNARNILLPAGATFDETSSTLIDETTVKSKGQPYGTPRSARAPRRRR